MVSVDTPKQQKSRKSIFVTSENETPQNNPYRTRRSALISSSTPISKSIETPKTPLILSRIEKSKAVTTTPKFLDPVMEKIQRDLNSPSATAKMRAQRALKSPGFRKANYEIFDVPHEEQDLITEEERQPYKPKTIREVFANCRIYVEVRTGDDNRSAGIKNKLLLDGIIVNEKLYKDTTHVIFKDGLLSTYKQAKKYGIPVTSILWIEECKAQRRLVDPSKFPIYNAERYDNPEIYGRVRRQKSSQPEINTIVLPRTKANACKTATQSVNNDDSFVNETIQQSMIDNNDPNEKTIEKCDSMELTGNNEDNDDIFTSSLNLTEKLKLNTPVNNRRLTTFTPQTMERTKCEIAPAWKSIERRKSIFTSSHLEETNTGSPFSSAQKSNNVNKSVYFNSANRIASNSRRSVFDISMNILDMNCKAINEKAKEESKELKKQDDNDDLVSCPSYNSISTTSSSASIKSTQKPAEPTAIRKRKLFTNVDADEMDNLKENIMNQTTNSAKKQKSKKSATKNENEKLEVKKFTDNRRKTISYFKPSSKTTEVVKKTKSNAVSKYICVTNMSSADKQKAQAVITKLGGIYESEVTEKTTHVITPTQERTMNLLRGIIRACYILKPSWLDDSEKAEKFIDTTLYHHDICNTQKIYERMVLGRNFKNQIFSHYGPFFINKDSIDNQKKIEYLKEIIQKCNGTLTKNKYDAKIIISDRPIPLYPSFRRPTVVQSTYIFDVAMQSKMLPTAKYTPKINN
ncbi:hypothetical protein PVAND_008308 [Polypedilum vanderplanki]|uniref:BRCT domain-containing protein n=1 Tax=Polypedilum vanderplanki TaxID=319348 RepID=A0A9J6C926_POLVA|nr:hypothetical protein PVAND_008308 [Polypedilum vanderplanki]